MSDNNRAVDREYRYLGDFLPPCSPPSCRGGAWPPRAVPEPARSGSSRVEDMTGSIANLDVPARRVVLLPELTGVYATLDHGVEHPRRRDGTRSAKRCERCPGSDLSPHFFSRRTVSGRRWFRPETVIAADADAVLAYPHEADLLRQLGAPGIVASGIRRRPICMMDWNGSGSRDKLVDMPPMRRR